MMVVCKQRPTVLHDTRNPAASRTGGLMSWAGFADDRADIVTHHPLSNRTVGYQLARWPDLPGIPRTAALLRALSVMSHRPVTIAWFAKQIGWDAGRAHEFLERLANAGEAQRVGAGTQKASQDR
jgi:hypothetical protein